MLAIPSVKGFLSEMGSLFLRIGSRLACHGHRVHRSTREFGKQECGSLESEITSWLRTSS